MKLTEIVASAEAPAKGSAQVNCRSYFNTRSFVIILAGTLCLCFARVVIGLNTLFYRDFGAQVYPSIYYLRDSLLHGELPVWNPLVHCGVPFMAQWGNWYPALLLSPLFPMPWFVNFLCIAHMLWGGLGMYWLCRRLGTSGLAASFAGLAFTFNGVSLGCLMWVSYTASLSWLPWTAGLSMAAWKQGGKWVGLAALASAMQVLAGAPELTLLFWLVLGVLWLAEVLVHETPFWKSFRRLVCVVGLAAAVTAVQMLPFFDLLSQSQRDRQFGNNGWAMPGWGWANLIVPLFHCYQAPQGPWFQPGQELINSYYLGLGVLALALVGCLTVRSRTTTLLGLAAVLCWAMALGSEGFLFDFAKKVFPLIGVARFPIKFAVLPAFLLPILAAFGADKTAEGSKNGLRLTTFVATGLIVLAAFLLWFARTYPFPGDNWKVTSLNGLWRIVLMSVVLFGLWAFGKMKTGGPVKLAVLACVLAVVPFDAFTHSPYLVPTLPSWNLAPGLWTASGNPKPPALAEGRIMLSPHAEQRLFYGSVPDRAIDFTRKRLSEWYNLNLLDGIAKINGAMILRPRYFDMIEQYAYFTPGAQLQPGLLDLLSVAWLSSPENPTAWVARTNCPPLVTAGQRPTFTSDEQALKGITASGFDPRTTVYLPASSSSLVTVTNHTDCAILATNFSGSQVDISVRATEPSLVLFSQAYYHLWKPSVDGKPVPLLRADLAFQAVQVPSGEHHIQLVYRDRNLLVGGTISIAGLFACGWIGLKRSRPKFV